MYPFNWRMCILIFDFCFAGHFLFLAKPDIGDFRPFADAILESLILCHIDFVVHSQVNLVFHFE